MNHTCHYCERETVQAHSITIYQKDGIEESYELLCASCYEDWLLSLKG